LIPLKIITRIESRVAADKYLGIEELNKILQEEISGLLSETNTGEATEFVIQKIKTIRFNGSRCKWCCKTTTIGKLASNLKSGL
jgi:fused signal recognition particle receptor